MMLSWRRSDKARQGPRSDLFEKFAVEKNINYDVAEKIVTEIFKSMSESLISGNRIEIRGFGSFELREYDGRTGRNPKTGVEVTVSPKKLPFFKTGKDLKERIQASGR
jgi:integration host factor subunit beta